LFGEITRRADLKAHIGLVPGINDSASIIGLPSTVGNGAGATSPYSQIDTRANYLSFGNESMGTIKLGRDIGIFGTQVILSDMTLLGAKGPGLSTVGGRFGSGVQKNKSFTLGVYHSLNKYLTLTGEFNNERKPGVVFLGEKTNTISLGAIAFF
jgi:hypothetical protein